MTHPIRDEQDLIQRVAAMRVRLDALEAENAALREFVGVVDDAVFLMANREDGDRFHDARQRLATDHGLPLSGAREADDGNDEYGYCDMCGEPLIFASMCTCASCVHELHS